MNAPPASAFERALVRALRPYPAEGRYLVGVSGGRDSVALLHALTAAGYRRLVVCHLEHGLRGRGWARGCPVCRAVGGGIRIADGNRARGRADPRPGRVNDRSKQRRARRVTHFFAEVAGRRRCRTLFLAHHADDQVETFLFNLLRGAGPAGLAGMAAESTRTVGRRTLCGSSVLCWPSGERRSTEYLQTHGLAWREDAHQRRARARHAQRFARGGPAVARTCDGPGGPPGVVARGGYPRRRGKLAVGTTCGGRATRAAAPARRAGGTACGPAAPNLACVAADAGRAKRRLPRD